MVPLCRGKPGGPGSSPRPMSVHWDSSVEEIVQPRATQGHLSDSNLSRYLNRKSRDGSPGRLRRIMQRFSSATITSPSRSPRVSVDSGIDKESSGKNLRARSPRWTRKFSSPLSSINFSHSNAVYEPLEGCPTGEENGYDVERVSWGKEFAF